MTALSWREVDFAGVVLAGAIAGYVMMIAGLWAGRIRWLATIDIADFGRRYVISDRPSAWFFGAASHVVNSILLTLVWACLVEPNLAWPRMLEGVAFGIALALLFAGLLVSPMAGLGLMGRKAGGSRYAATNILMHVLWGLVIGAVYVTR